ncbi:MAG TPA: hypothetical protein VGM82_00150 [Gemmatimonadaceae bacterium]|jgi:hypothetical protein
MLLTSSRVRIATAALVYCGLFAPSAGAAEHHGAPQQSFENVNMNTTLSVEGGHLVVRWSTRGFHHYNIRWSENKGKVQQVEREGDKDFRYLSVFRRGVVYRVAVQGCRKSFASKSQCTSWDEAVCGTPDKPCR